MKDGKNLEAYIGLEKTLLITDSGFEIQRYVKPQDKIFTHYSTEHRLRRYDPEQKEMLEYYIEHKQCTQVIFAASQHKHLIKQIQEDESLYSAAAALKFNLNALLKHHHDRIINPDIHNQMLTELNVIIQCKFLMDYFFIKNKVNQDKLILKGVVTVLHTEQFKSIFHNGIIYNDILNLN